MSGEHTSPQPPRSLRRSADEKILAGVCGGLGEHFGVNAWWFRWAFVVLVFFGFAGIGLYLLAWLLMPRAYGESSIVEGWFDDLDLTDVGTIEVSIGAGEIVVALPFGVGTVVRATVGAGSIRTDVSFHELYMPAPPAIQQAFEDCRSIGPGRRDCEALLFPDGLPYEEYPWDEHRNMSGIGLSRSFEMGHPPFDLILDLRIGAGEIWVQQIGEIRAYELDWEGSRFLTPTALWR